MNLWDTITDCIPKLEATPRFGFKNKSRNIKNHFGTLSTYFRTRDCLVLNIFVKNKAVKKKVNKGRSLAMRHVSRTLRVDLNPHHFSTQLSSWQTSSQRIIHRRDMDTTDTTGEHHDTLL